MIVVDSTSIVPVTEHEFDVEDKIRRFQRLGDGWSYARGIRFDPEVIDLAVNLTRKVIDLGFIDIDASPGLNGEIQIDIYGQVNSLELIVEPDRSFNSTWESRAGELIRDVDRLSYDAAILELDNFGRVECSSESSIRFITTQRSADLGALPSEAAIYQSFLNDAQMRDQVLSAPTFLDSMRESPERLPFIGDSLGARPSNRETDRS